MSIFDKNSLKDTLSKLSTSAMDVAENVVKATKEGANSVAKKSNDILEISKLNSSISKENNKIQELYCEIGKNVYSKFHNNVYIDPELVEMCNQIREKQFNVAVMEDRICDLKNLCKCTNCGMSLKPDDKYCPKCGQIQFTDKDSTEKGCNCTEEIAQKCSCTENPSEECNNTEKSNTEQVKEDTEK